MIFQVVLLATVASLAASSIVPVVHHAPQPYKFGYDIKDHHGEQYREEEGNGGHAVRGSYGFTDARGVKRQVNYVADHAGFRAQVNTNEPGTANQNPAAVQVNSAAPYALGGIGHGVLGHGVAAPVLGHGVGLAGRGLGLGYGLGGLGVGRPGYGLGGIGVGRLGYGLGGLGNGLGGLGYGLGGLGYGLGGLGYSA